MNAAHVLAQVEAHLRACPDAAHTVAAVVSQALQEPDGILLRSTMRGHVTASALVLSPCRRRVLMVRHLSLGRLLQPGGHWQSGTLIENAAREAEEETGVAVGQALADHPVDIDNHGIPANPGKDEGAHLHHDFLYAFEADDAAPIVAQLDEVEQAGWVDVDDAISANPRLAAAICRCKRLPDHD